MFKSLKDWFFRRYARGTFDLLRDSGGLPAGLDPEDRIVRARVGRVAWILGKNPVAVALADSPTPLGDLDAMEVFVEAVRRVPRDCFDRSLEGRSLYSSGRAMSRKGWKPPRSRWTVAAHLLKQAIEIARRGERFELMYRPSQTEQRACNRERDDETFLIRAAELTLRPIEQTPNEKRSAR